MLTSRTERSPVDEYLAGLDRALGGSRRRRADLLQEARDSLDDATEVFQAEGLSRREAEERAVADFGTLAQVVPGYRAELAISSGRRTATLLCLVLLVQPIVWLDDVWGWDRDAQPPSELNLRLNELIESAGTVALIGAVFAVVAHGIGLRYPAVRDRVTRWTAVFALTCVVLVGLMGLAMASASRTPGLIPTFGAVSVFLLLPLSVVALSAARTLRLTRGWSQGAAITRGISGPGH